ncbi:Major facilitator superfamily domain general substrate transporter [Penicillium alfredii]|uniref:Major facilitator superfamily domain general substrate transporter n=1 Tax=Penicillium alfredii TaxID=1506179 RepID=A0A9W9FJP2_9EURO|nr:Major facilitator superfamily domain general substrate transporter [Penicillium alfredii]KAJ5101395.1 Major facilitator superfamily domain general substrate transporter [Penicillium alfredii]
MSLVQHVSALEGFDREPDPDAPDDFAPIRRTISYDVLQPPSQTVPVAVQRPGTPAYKHSDIKRIVQVAVTVLTCWSASGIVFGFAALKPVLVAEGVYHDRCTDDELREGIQLCSQQDIKYALPTSALHLRYLTTLRLNLFFTIASITANVSALPVGTILDRYGSRLCGLIGCFLLAIGSLFMAFSFLRPRFQGYIAGNFFLALAGTFIFVPSFQIANAFPKYAGTIVALVTGAFDASAAVFLFYRLVYETSSRFSSPAKFFLGYLAVPVLIFIALVTIMPSRDYNSTLQLESKMERAEDATRDVHESDDDIENEADLQVVRKKRAAHRKNKMRQIDGVLGDKDERQQRADREEDRQQTSQVWGVLHGLPAYQQMATPWFILITLLTVLQMVRMNYFIATIRAQYEYMLGSVAQAEMINSVFDIALPVGGVLFTPFIGFLLDRLSVPAMLGLIVVCTTVIGVLNSIPTVWAGYLTVFFFVLLRPLYYSAMSDYTTKVFGFATFGRVYGTIICLSGLVNFSQYGLDALTHHKFNGNPIPINGFLAVAGLVVGIALVSFVCVAGRQMREHEDVDEERQRLILEEDDDEYDEPQRWR